MARSFNIVVVNPASPIKSIADLIAAARAEPDKLSYGTYGTGTSAHLAGELFKHMAKVNLTTVPYKGSAPAITDLLGGQIQVMFTTVASAASLVEAGQLRAHRGDLGGALAGLSATADGRRKPAFPAMPLETWYGLFAPGKTPPDIIDRLNKSAAKAVQSEAFKKLAVNEGLVMVAGAAGRARPIFPRRGGALAQGDPGRRDQGGVAAANDPLASAPRNIGRFRWVQGSAKCLAKQLRPSNGTVKRSIQNQGE